MQMRPKTINFYNHSKLQLSSLLSRKIKRCARRDLRFYSYPPYHDRRGPRMTKVPQTRTQYVMANDRGGGKGVCNAHDAGTLAI